MVITKNKLIEILKTELKSKNTLTLAIDGRCASGKSTLGKELSESFDCNLFHIDDYFLRPEQRTEERLNTPGGNFDIERFKEEVINGITSGENFCYSPFDCSKMDIGDKISVNQKALNIIEGSYSCHPEISENYDITVFITTDTETQKNRILNRNPDRAQMFFKKWIPLEESYISHFDIKNHCDYIIET